MMRGRTTPLFMIVKREEEKELTSEQILWSTLLSPSIDEDELVKSW